MKVCTLSLIPQGYFKMCSIRLATWIELGEAIHFVLLMSILPSASFPI